jgi:hypothetical protein
VQEARSSPQNGCHSTTVSFQFSVISNIRWEGENRQLVPNSESPGPSPHPPPPSP